MSTRPRINWYKIVGIVLILGGVLVAAYPFSPLILYQIKVWTKGIPEPLVVYTAEDYVGVDEDFTPNYLPEIADKALAGEDVTGLTRNKVVIPKIGVDMEIVEGNQYALEKGAWHLPNTAAPEDIGNTILTGHRYKYRPPATNTFYLLDKLAVGDTFIIHWEGKELVYRIDRREIKSANDFSMLEDTFDRRVTLITCDPLFSTTNRLIVSGRLVKQ